MTAPPAGCPTRVTVIGYGDVGCDWDHPILILHRHRMAGAETAFWTDSSKLIAAPRGWPTGTALPAAPVPSTATARCEATDGEGHRCVYLAHSLSGYHMYSNNPHRFDYYLGKLQSAVSLFLDGSVDRDFLARTLAETEGER